MHVVFKNPGFEYMIESIMEFQKDDTTSFWSDSLYYFYSEIDKEHVKSLSEIDRKRYITEILKTKYREIEKQLNEKILMYNSYWNQNEDVITAAFSDAFDIDCSEILNDMICNISMNPISPRFLSSHAFDLFYLNSEKGALGNALHEITHFLWFKVWNGVFNDSYEEYETPSLKWIISELVVEAVMSDERLSNLNPYYPRNQGGCIYQYFFTMEIDGNAITDTVLTMYKSMNIKDFMKKIYDYCLLNERAIRDHIEASEK